MWPCASQRRELGLTRLCRLSHSPPRGEATSGKPFSSNLSILCLAWTPASPNLVLNILKAIFVINKDILLLFTKSRLTVYDPVDCSTPGFPVLHHLPEFAQSHVH